VKIGWIWNWIGANKEWLFSGVGVAVVALVLRALFRRKPSSGQSQSSGSRSMNLQAGGDINISVPTPVPSVPEVNPPAEFSVACISGVGQCARGRTADELKCIWKETLTLTNLSPYDAFKVRLHVEGEEVEVQPPPSVIKSGDSASDLEFVCWRYIDRREVHPSAYLPPSPDPQPPNRDALRDCCPDEVTGLKASLSFEDSDGQRFVQTFIRKPGQEEMETDGPVAMGDGEGPAC